ncbi:SusC/RagA family TonB-linked outer membrane protein [Parapedobacter tibetensis]|uniref:SusC/RagA family TonB-linked outer membrane protein n=1 Tax=Parapedobacter tibetensis TaxID=2972951 RepID=UPI00214DAB60|nr:TonB-dependent receptor [Parapedobacter tibetensis]
MRKLYDLVLLGKFILIFLSVVYCTVVHAQEILAISGTVTASEDSSPLEGVSVAVRGQATTTQTDKQGNYHINAAKGSYLVFRSIGFEEQAVEVVGSTIDIVLIASQSHLDEVVVVGYGTQLKRDVTGAVSRVSASTIQERPVQNLFEALQGKVAGINASTNFRPGELPVIRIRGNRSLNASNEPLYVIDNIPLVAGSITDISPNDIESMEILKDASATAIYGSRGANGVVLITTKKGSAGRVTVNYRATTTLDRYKSLTEWMGGGEYIDRWRESLMNGGLYSTAEFTDLNTPIVPGYPDPFEDEQRMGLGQDVNARNNVWKGYEWDVFGETVRTRSTTAQEQAWGWPAQVPIYNSANIPTYDWIDNAIRQGVTQNHQLSVSAGTETSRVYLSMDYFDQLGVQKDQDYERFAVNLNGDITPNSWLTVGASVMASLAVQNFGILPPNTSNTGSKDLYSRAADQFPYAPMKDENGDYIRNSGGNLQLFNPLIDIDQVKNERRIGAVSPNLFAEVKFIPWLKYRLNFGAQFRSFRNGLWTGPEATSHLTNRPNTAGYNTSQQFSWVAENLLFVDKTFADIHTINVTLLQSAQRFRTENIGANVAGNIYDISYWYDLASNTNGAPQGYGTGFSENTLMSWMGRVNYSLLDRYLVTVTGRYDGSSVLAPGHKWDFFPSFALAWKMQEEEFLAGVDWLNELKLRVGYGITGNSAVNPYSTSGPLSRNPYVFGSTPAIGYLPQLVKNPLLGWEKTAQINVGVDFAIVDNRFSGSIEYYEGNTFDLIMPKTLPAVSGYVQKLENVGKTRNRGVELTLSTVNIRNDNFSWSTDFNWSNNREEIVELLNGKEDMLANRWFIGQPLQVYFQYDNAGIWQNTTEDLAEMAKFNANGHQFHPGTIKVVDQNGDYRITGDDMVVLGTTRPKWTGGITNTLTYKNWTFSSFIYARWGQTYFGGYPNSYGGIWPNGRVENDVWRWDNPDGKWPMPNSGNVENITAAMQYHDGSFIAVRNISLSYDFPQSWLAGRFIKNIQLNAQVLNPFIFGKDIVKYGINPDDETNWSVASSNTNPLGGMNNNTVVPQSYVFGLRAGF